MRTYPADEDESRRELDHDNESVIIAFDIEDVVLVANIVSAREVLPDVGQRLPSGMQRYVVPSFEWCSCVSMVSIDI